MNAPRVVLDTNVVLSALVFPSGRLAWVRAAWRASRIFPLVSSVTAAELIRALAYPKFQLSEEDRQELLGDYLPYSEAVSMPAKPPRVPTCRDPLDVPFLQLALVGGADFLATGDKDLLALREKFSVPILTPEELRVAL